MQLNVDGSAKLHATLFNHSIREVVKIWFAAVILQGETCKNRIAPQLFNITFLVKSQRLKINLTK